MLLKALKLATSFVKPKRPRKISQRAEENSLPDMGVVMSSTARDELAANIGVPMPLPVNNHMFTSKLAVLFWCALVFFFAGLGLDMVGFSLAVDPGVAGVARWLFWGCLAVSALLVFVVLYFEE